MKKILFLVLAFSITTLAYSQLNPVKWSYAATRVGQNEFDLRFTADIEKGWYVYSQYLESNEGPVATTFVFEVDSNTSLVGETKEEGTKHEGYDELFAMNIIKFSGKPVFTQRVRVNSFGKVTGYLTFMTCDDEKCLPPKDVEYSFDLK